MFSDILPIEISPKFSEFDLRAQNSIDIFITNKKCLIVMFSHLNLIYITLYYKWMEITMKGE